MKSASTLTTASSTVVPRFSFALSQERYDADCCQGIAGNTCQRADAATGIIQNLLRFPTELLSFSVFWEKRLS